MGSRNFRSELVWAPTPSQLAIDNYWQSFPQWSFTRCINHTSGRDPCPEVAGQHKIDLIFLKKKILSLTFHTIYLIVSFHLPQFLTDTHHCFFVWFLLLVFIFLHCSIFWGDTSLIILFFKTYFGTSFLWYICIYIWICSSSVNSAM